MQFASPSIEETIEDCVSKGAKQILLHPFFLSPGIHVSKDIPEIIAQAQALYPHVEFIYTEPLGLHEKLIDAVIDRLKTSGLKTPKHIEQRSLEIISAELDATKYPPAQVEIIKRVIHATADFEFADTLVFHPEAIGTAMQAIKAGKDILVDVQMLKVAINANRLKDYGCRVHCYIDDADVLEGSVKTSNTRAELAITKAFASANNIGIVAIGNAPTALLKTIEILRGLEPQNRPVVIGVPVGFVNAFESKLLLSSLNSPFITNLSKKGGSAVAGAIINAITKMLV